VTDEAPWNWADVAVELRPLVEALTPEEAKRVLVVLFAETPSKEEYLAARLSGIIRGTIARRRDEARKSPRG
jgi:hypothetical protein